MRAIHYFQRYSQKENVVTNNTLLLFSRLYSYNPLRLETFLQEILKDAPIEVGVSFRQQIKSKAGSVPDGTMTQASFKIVMETKLLNSHGHAIEQLTSHLKAFGREDKKILLSLSPVEPSDEFQKEVKNFIKNHNKKTNSNIKYVCTTFEQIIDSYENILSDQDYEMKDLLEDYKSFCEEAGLFPETDFLMRAVTCGWTLDENLEFNLYYDPVSRSCRKHKYIGIYSDKCIRGIGEIENIIHADLIEGSLQVKKSATPVTEDQKQRIIAVIPHAKEACGYEIANDHKFFMAKKFYPTEFKKTTKGPLRGVQYFNLKEIIKYRQTTKYRGYCSKIETV